MKNTLWIAVLILLAPYPQAIAQINSSCREDAGNAALAQEGNDSYLYRISRIARLRAPNANSISYYVWLGEADDQDGPNAVVGSFTVVLDAKSCAVISIR